MLSLALILEFPTFTNHKISITLLIFPKCRGAVMTSPSAKLQKICNTVIASKRKKLHNYSFPMKKMRIMRKMQGYYAVISFKSKNITRLLRTSSSDIPKASFSLCSDL